MNAYDLHPLIRARLAERGVSLRRTLEAETGDPAHVWHAWAVFREIAAMAFNDAIDDPEEDGQLSVDPDLDGDLLRFEVTNGLRIDPRTVPGVDTGRVTALHLVRELVLHDEDGDRVDSVVLRLTLLFSPGQVSAAGAAIEGRGGPAPHEGTKWSDAVERASAFVHAREASASFGFVLLQP